MSGTEATSKTQSPTSYDQVLLHAHHQSPHIHPRIPTTEPSPNTHATAPAATQHRRLTTSLTVCSLHCVHSNRRRTNGKRKRTNERTNERTFERFGTFKHSFVVGSVTPLNTVHCSLFVHCLPRSFVWLRAAAASASAAAGMCGALAAVLCFVTVSHTTMCVRNLLMTQASCSKPRCVLPLRYCCCGVL